MVARKLPLEKRLAELVDQFTPEIRKSFLSALKDVKDTTILKDIVEAIELGDVERAFRSTGIGAAAMRPVSSMLERAFETGGVTTGASFPTLKSPRGGRTVFRFDVRDNRAEAWLRQESAGLVVQIENDTREAIRTAIETGMREGRNPRNVALDLVGRINPKTGSREGGIVGLHSQYAKFVNNARTELQTLDPNYLTRVRRDKRFDGIVQKAIKDGKPLDAETINRLTGRYSDSLLQLRGETIGRTEALKAINKAEFEAFEQAIDKGSLKQENVTRIWDSAGDDGRTRDTHLTMEGQTVKFKEPFKTPDGASIMFPGDGSLGAGPEETINCRCRVKTKVDWLADIEAEGRLPGDDNYVPPVPDNGPVVPGSDPGVTKPVIEPQPAPAPEMTDEELLAALGVPVDVGPPVQLPDFNTMTTADFNKWEATASVDQIAKVDFSRVVKQVGAFEDKLKASLAELSKPDFSKMTLDEFEQHVVNMNDADFIKFDYNANYALAEAHTKSLSTGTVALVKELGTVPTPLVSANKFPTLAEYQNMPYAEFAKWWPTLKDADFDKMNSQQMDDWQWMMGKFSNSKDGEISFNNDGKAAKKYPSIDPTSMSWSYVGPADIGGAHPKQFWKNDAGETWLFKPAQADGAFIPFGEQAASEVARQIDPQAIIVKAITLGGKPGSIQQYLTDVKSFPASLKPSDLLPGQMAQIQREHVIDWLMSNHDSHVGNFIQKSNGHILGIDKAQSFKHLGDDKLSIDYHPNAKYGEKEPFYNTFWRAARDGKIAPNLDETFNVVKRLQALDDEDYENLLRPYAEGRFKSPSAVNDFLNKASARKADLKKDFERFFDDLGISAKAQLAKIQTALPDMTDDQLLDALDAIVVKKPRKKKSNGGKATMLALENAEALDPKADKFVNMIASNANVRNHDKLPNYIDRRTSSSLNNYVGMGYGEINEYLRMGDKYVEKSYFPKSEVERQIKEIQSLMKPAPYDFVAYRGIRSQLTQLVDDLEPGAEFPFEGLTSMARASEVSMRFARQNGALFQVLIPKGTKMVITNDHETEMLMDHGHKYRVLSKTAMPSNPNGVKWFYVVEFIS